MKKDQLPYNKYHVSVKSARTLDGIVFDSKREMLRYQELKLLEKAGEIKDLVLQPKFPLQIGFGYRGKHYRPITYIADFSYHEGDEDFTIVEDCKGMLTAEYRIKKKLFLYKYSHVDFREI